MSSTQYDVDETTRELLIIKAKRRAELREQCLKMKTNPFQHATGQGGVVFDPAFQRYQAMTVSQYEYFKPTAKNSLYGICLMVAPMVVFGYFLQRSRTNYEATLRRGEVAYKDRRFKCF